MANFKRHALLQQQEFNTDGPDQVWVGDITYVWTAEGWAYLAVFLDLYSRRVVGWATADHMRSELVNLALKRAVETRGPHGKLIVHSDRGSQYASESFRKEIPLDLPESITAISSTGRSSGKSREASVKAEPPH